MTDSADGTGPESIRQGRLATMADKLGLALCLAPLAMIGGDTPLARQVATGGLIVALVLAGLNLFRANRALAGTALRPATVWALLAVLCAGIGLIAEDDAVPGRPRQGFFVHLSFLATLAALVSVLGARKPGESAWAILCGLFLAIGLLPMLEGIGLARRFDLLDRLRSESPWTYFFVLVIIAGAGNYLPTRFGLPALILGGGLGYHLRLLWTPEGRAEWRGDFWFVFPWALAAAVSAGALVARRTRKFDAPEEFQRFWMPFRDAWGAAWALRVLERVNQTSIRNGWPERLTWFGLMRVADMEQAGRAAPDRAEMAPSTAEAEPAAADFPNAAPLTSTLKVFLRRFGDPDVIRKF